MLITPLLLFASCLTAADRPPNIVFIFADDLGYGDLGCYGHPYAKTPNLDTLAKEGTRFEQYYVTGVTCNPSRTGLMTGFFPARFPKYAANYGFGDRKAVTELLKKRGYRTGHFGKWHIGPKSTEVDGQYGIDTVRVIGSTKEDPDGRDAGLFKAAVEFIRQNREHPFYVNIWGHSTHFPVHVVPQLSEVFKERKVKRSDFSKTMQHKFDECVQIGGNLDEAMHQYLGDVYSIDGNVGRVMKVLDELGLRDNTILVFSSDHGPAPVLLGKEKSHREHSCNMLGYAGQFRGGKHEQLEGGTRVPFIIRWPGRVKAGRVDKESVCSFIDWLPTLCSITGIKDLPGKLDGEDISDIWLGKSRARTRPLFWKVSSVNGTPAMREGKWKLHLNLKGKSSPELYDLSIDPAEMNNVAEKNPDVLKAMTTKIRAWNDTLPKAYDKPEKKKKKEKARKKDRK
jgi:N-acetylgalactosamine-6-sulfatase